MAADRTVPRIVVVGSINTDMCVFAPELPRRGETVLGGAFRQTHGGKGANQAVAAARLGARVAFVGCVGDDQIGRDALDALRAEGIETAHVRVVPGTPSGVALILVDAAGENMIAVASGANALVSPADVDAAAETIAGADYVLLQMEVPPETVAAAAAAAGAAGVPVLLNAAPAPDGPLAAALLDGCAVLVVNTGELQRLVPDAPEPDEAAARLLAAGPRAVVLTRGADGTVLYERTGTRRYPAFSVTPIDTVGAGDCFAGALAVGLGRGAPMDEALRRAMAAAAISVTRVGAQSSMPTAGEVDAFMEQFARNGRGRR